MTKFGAAVALIGIYMFSMAGCGTLGKLSRLTQKTTVEECTELTTAIVAKACKNIGNVRDRAQNLVDNVNIAVDTVPEK